MINFIKRWRPAPRIDPRLWSGARKATPWIAALDAGRDARLQSLAARLLHDKAITPVAGLTLDDAERTQLAALCCLPLLEFGVEGLHGWSQLIVYPDAFRAHRSHVDAAGVMHEWDDDLIGEAWESGPVIRPRMTSSVVWAVADRALRVEPISAGASPRRARNTMRRI